MKKFKKLKEDYMKQLKENLENSRKIMELEDRVAQREKAFEIATKDLKDLKNEKGAYLEEMNKTLYRNDYDNTKQVVEKIRELTRAYEETTN